MKYLAAICFFLLVYCCEAQSSKVKFGSVSLEELKNASFPQDTTAEAVILYDKGHFDGLRMNFTRHVRIKVLKPSGTQWGNIVLNVPSQNNIKAFVFNLQDGQIIKEEVKRSSIYEEKVIDKFYVYKIFVPNVQVGSVIDVQYFFYGIPFEWRFQERIPVLYSELHFEECFYLKYSKIQLGFEPVETISETKWVARNMPAFKTEPFVSNYRNYLTKFMFDIVSLGRPGYTLRYSEISSSWEQINDILLEYDRFGGVLNACSFLNDKAKEIKAMQLSVEEKIALATEYIKSNIKWNAQENFYASLTYAERFKKDHSGNSADINLLLVALLRKIGLSAYPVVLRTREEGYLIRQTPSIQRINYVIAYVNHSGNKLLIDATETKLPPGFLPFRCLNGHGLVVKEGPAEWVDLAVENKNLVSQKTFIKIGEDGDIDVTITQQLDQYACIERHDYLDQSEGHEKYITEFEKNFNGVKILDYQLTEYDPKNLRLKETFRVGISSSIVDTGDQIIFSPNILSKFTRNPFNSDTRKYPVDMGYASEYSNIIAINVPAAFSVKSLPSPVKYITEDGGAMFELMSVKQASGVQMKINIKFKRAIYAEAEYPELRQFCSLVVKKLGESIEIVK